MGATPHETASPPLPQTNAMVMTGPSPPCASPAMPLFAMHFPECAQVPWVHAPSGGRALAAPGA